MPVLRHQHFPEESYCITGEGENHDRFHPWRGYRFEVGSLVVGRDDIAPRCGYADRLGGEIIHRVHRIEEDGHLFYLSSIREDTRARVVLFLVLEQSGSYDP